MRNGILDRAARTLGGRRGATLLVLAALAATLAFAPRAGAYVYWANNFGTIGRANLDGTGPSQMFVTGANYPCGVAVDSLPSNAFTLGKANLNKKKGTAKLPVDVPGPGTLVLAGKGLKKVTERVAKRASDREVKLLVKSKGKKRRKLNKLGKVKVKPKVTYTPTDGSANTELKKVKLVKRG